LAPEIGRLFALKSYAIKLLFAEAVISADQYFHRNSRRPDQTLEGSCLFVFSSAFNSLPFPLMSNGLYVPNHLSPKYSALEVLTYKGVFATENMANDESERKDREIHQRSTGKQS
jgi:hypothetical protein